MNEFIISVGIDIGTSTTQLVFCQLQIQNVSGFGDIPRIEIVNKKIIYRSQIHFTPLLLEEIDSNAVKEIILEEYRKAGMKPEQVMSGAVIITGETSRKRNAKAVLHALSDIAGDFVVAVAGPNQESVLAGKGSGACELSEKTGKLVVNLDIGGGTTNICYFQDGKVVDTACLDIGGRLIKIADGRITYLSTKIKQLLERLNISLQLGDIIEATNKEGMDKLKTLAEYMVLILEQSISPHSTLEELELMKTNQLITSERVPELIVLSGGVADCVRNRIEDKFIYGDIGVILGDALRASKLFQEKVYVSSHETMNATVIGTGNYSLEVSGSTIEYANCSLPMKNIPVIYFDMEEDRLSLLHKEIMLAVNMHRDEDDVVQLALASKGLKCPTFAQIEQIAKEIVIALEPELKRNHILLLILEADIGKALGQAIKRILPRGTPFLCIDRISCHYGDYIDIGIPVASGKVIPVVVKTLIFNT